MFSPNPIAHEAIVLRRAERADEAALQRLAALDSARPLTGSAVVVEHQGTIVAARSLESDREIADPFVPTTGLMALLRLHAESQPALPRRALNRLASRSTAGACC